jgi:hypothetical protein
MVVLVILGFVLGGVGALVAQSDARWRVIGGAIAIAGLALVVYELVFCDC